jgi:hypothetical protein
VLLEGGKREDAMSAVGNAYAVVCKFAAVVAESTVGDENALLYLVLVSY